MKNKTPKLSFRGFLFNNPTITLTIKYYVGYQIFYINPPLPDFVLLSLRFLFKAWYLPPPNL